jgi:hypothetical protein
MPDISSYSARIHNDEDRPLFDDAVKAAAIQRGGEAGRRGGVNVYEMRDVCTGTRMSRPPCRSRCRTRPRWLLSTWGPLLRLGKTCTLTTDEKGWPKTFVDRPSNLSDFGRFCLSPGHGQKLRFWPCLLGRQTRKAGRQSQFSLGSTA